MSEQAIAIIIGICFSLRLGLAAGRWRSSSASLKPPSACRLAIGIAGNESNLRIRELNIISVNDTATLVVQHDVQATAKNRYEEWLKDIALEAQNFPGHMGVNIIRPHGISTIYTIVLRFDSTDRLESWLQSDIRKRLIEEIRPALVNEEKLNVETGLEYWFTPPEMKQMHAKPFKQFLVTLSAIFPLTIVVPWLLKPIFTLVPLLGRPIISNLVLAIVIVYLMVYMIMPRYARIVAKWLFS